MHWRKFFSLLGMLILLLTVLPVAAAQPPRVDKIEARLLDELAGEGTADMMVRFGEQADLSAAYSMDWEARGWYVYNTLTATAARAQADARAYLDKAGLEYESYYSGNELYVWGGTLETATALAALPEVAVLYAPRTYYIDHALATANPVTAPEVLDWGLIDVNADDFWTAFGMQGDGIVVANIDTGVQWDHPALDQAFHCPGQPGNPECWRDPSNICAGGTACDNNGHGTHTMGTMVGDDDPSLTYQVGMAPNAQWIACKGCETNSCSDTALNACADWIVAPNGNPNARPHVVNNSWGGGGGDNWYQVKVQAWRAAGVFPAFSAGNSTGCGSLGSPGDYQESFGTTGHNSSRAHVYAQGPSATFGHDPYTKPNITAPASSICSSVPTNSWSCGYSGTSMASPHSAGAVALLWSCNPSFIGQMNATFEALQNSADAPDPANPPCGVPPDNQGTYEDGYGYLNVYQMGLDWCGDVGNLDGYVLDAGTAQPIEGAVVDAGGPTDTTDATGYYHITLMAGTYDVNAAHPQYTTAYTTGVVVTANATTTVDFDLQPRGWLWGYVTDYDNGTPLEGAVVTAEDGTWAETDAAGYYEMYLDEGTYVVTATAADYAPESATVVIVSDQGTQQDFALQAAVVFIPSPLHVTVTWMDTYNEAATLTNRLAGPYDFEFLELPGGFIPGALGVPDAAWPGPDGYGYLGEALDYDWIDIVGTGTSVALADDNSAGPFNVGFTFPFYGANQTQFYVGSNGFISFGAGSSALTNQCPLPNATAPNNLIALMWDDLDPGDTSDLVWYQSFASCPVGPGACLVVQYENYHHYPGGGTIAGTFEAVLYENGSVRMQFEDTGAELGSGSTTGIEGNNQPSDHGLTYACDTANSLVDGAAMCYVYPGSAGCLAADIPWFGQDPVSGTVPAQSSFNPTMYFTATPAVGVNQPGDYYCDLRISGDPQLQVRVTMTVEPSADLGQVHGYVVDNCTGAPLEEVLVEIAGGLITETLTGPDGYYSAWLYAGTYQVDFSLAGYLAGSYSVDIVAGQSVVLDVNLLPDAPCIAVDPLSFEVWVFTGTAVYTDATGLDIYNNGGQDLSVSVMELDGGYAPPLAGWQPAPVAGFYDAAAVADVVGANPIAATGPIAVPVAGYVPEAVLYDNGPLVTHPGGGAGGADASALQTALGLTIYGFGNQFINGYRMADDFVVDHPGGWQVDAITFFAYQTGSPTNPSPITGVYYQIWDGPPNDPGSSVIFGDLTTNRLVNTTWSNAYRVLDTGLTNTQRPIMANTASAGLVLPMGTYWIDWLTNGSLSSGPWAPPISILGQTTTGNGLQYTTAWAAALDGSYQQGLPFVIEGLMLGGDVPWFWEVPTSTVIPATSMENLGIYFTALYTDMTPMPLGTYTATMMLTNNAGDPVEVPVMMHIIDQVITPTAAFTATTPVCLGEETWFYFTGDPGSPAADEYTWWFGDGVSMTVAGPDPVMHPYAAAGLYTVTLEVCITNWNACDSTTGVVEVLALPMAGFDYWANGLTVTFTDTSMYANAWLWDFGDGITDTVANPVHTYAAEGTYTVTQWVFGDCGDDMVQEVVTVVECAPVEILTVTEDIAGCVATFGTEFAGTLPITWLWDFGAFGTSTATNPVVDFGASGTYPYTLTAENCGGPTTWVDEVTVVCCAEVAIVTYTYDIAGCVVDFDLELTGDAPFTYLWAFGDGLTSTLAAPSHTYTQTGTYNVTVDVYNCAEGHDMVAFDVTVDCAVTYYVYLPIIVKPVAP